MKVTAVVVIASHDTAEKHAWVPGEQATLCGIQAAETRRLYERFPPTNGTSCLNCIGLAWNMFGRLTWT